MKELSRGQKFILLLYLLLLVISSFYFIPYKINDYSTIILKYGSLWTGPEYRDETTLRYNEFNHTYQQYGILGIDITKLTFEFIFVSVLFGILFLLMKNVQFTISKKFKFWIKQKRKSFAYLFILLAGIFFVFLIINILADKKINSLTAAKRSVESYEKAEEYRKSFTNDVSMQNIETLYKNLIRDGYKLSSISEFKIKIKNYSYLDSLYNVMKKDNYFLPSIDTFLLDIGYNNSSNDYLWNKLNSIKTDSIQLYDWWNNLSLSLKKEYSICTFQHFKLSITQNFVDERQKKEYEINKQLYNSIPEKIYIIEKVSPIISVSKYIIIIVLTIIFFVRLLLSYKKFTY